MRNRPLTTTTGLPFNVLPTGNAFNGHRSIDGPRTDPMFPSGYSIPGVLTSAVPAVAMAGGFETQLVQTVPHSSVSSVPAPAINGGHHKLGFPTPPQHEARSRKTSQQPHSNLEKTEMCRSWREFGKCPYGSKCRFAHGEAELRPKDGVVDRTRKQQLCIAFHGEGCCYYGERCTFLHELEPTSGRWKPEERLSQRLELSRLSAVDSTHRIPQRPLSFDLSRLSSERRSSLFGISSNLAGTEYGDGDRIPSPVPIGSNRFSAPGDLRGTARYYGEALFDWSCESTWDVTSGLPQSAREHQME